MKPQNHTETQNSQTTIKTVDFDWWEAQGQSHWGNTTTRNGKRVACGHKHRSSAACNRCLSKMRKDRPGHCQTYRIAHRQGYYVIIRRPTPSHP